MSLLGFSSCTKTLEEDPYSKISPNQFFTSEAQCIQAINGVYSGLSELFGQEDLWKSIEQGTDLLLYVPTNDFNQEYTFTAASPGNVTGIWRKCFASIANANMVINRVGKSNVTEATKNRVLGEALYLRSLYYYMLTNSFGNVPMWTEELPVDQVSVLPRTPLEIVHEQLKKDLLQAANYLPDTYPSSEVGRATKGAAMALLAKICLFDGKWADAAKYAQQVIDLGIYQLVDYDKLFDPNLKFRNNKESIFEIQYLRVSSSNSNIVTNYYYTWFMPTKDANNKTYAGVDFGSNVFRGYENYYPSSVLVGMFEDGDKRKEVTLASGYNGQTFSRNLKPGRPWFGAKFWDFQANDRNSGKNLYFQRYSDVLLILAEAQNELGNAPEALNWINKVRLEHGGLQKPLSNLSKDEIRLQIFKERGIEFVGEFQRKWDLVRWKKLVEAVKSAANDNPLGAKNVKDFHGIFPIPEAEITKNPNLLPQNQGY